ncbi:MAG: copper oxidase, partial [Methylibium sp.]|nr:copper oxidase [Methylibium sp.]
PRTKHPHIDAVDRDYAFLLNAYDIEPGSAVPKVMTMLDFNLWSWNSRVFPGIAPLVARQGERVRIRVGNLTMTNHPIHLHGHEFTVTGTDGGPVPRSARWPEVTTDVGVGQMRQIEFIADEEGDWALHCHKAHHTMNAMGHGVPTMIGVDASDLEAKIRRLVPGYMAMGQTGMHEMAEMHMAGPENTAPMMAGDGPYGPIAMGGMFSVLKVRRGLRRGDYNDPGWFQHPAGTLAREVGEAPPLAPTAPDAAQSPGGVEVDVRRPRGHHGH